MSGYEGDLGVAMEAQAQSRIEDMTLRCVKRVDNSDIIACRVLRVEHIYHDATLRAIAGGHCQQ